MNRLQLELHRLYLPAATPAAVDFSEFALIDGRRMVRTLVMEVTAPASWEVLGRVWHGVQTELELPAPGIAVSGTDGLQLWFSLVDAISVAEANAFLEGLRLRFLPNIPARRIRMLPASASASASGPGGSPLHAAIVPARQEPTGNWSAFIAPDLAPVFDETPWLDIPPGEEGQASLLRGLLSVRPSAFAAAAAQLRAAETTSAPLPMPLPVPPSAAADSAADGPTLQTAPSVRSTVTATGAAAENPESFLLRVMNDPTVALGDRIDAATALLTFSRRQNRRFDDAG